MNIEKYVSIRGLTKALSYRFFTTLATVLFFWLVTGQIFVASGIALFEIIAHTAIYYFHERAWKRISWRKKNNDNSGIFR